MNNKLVSIIVPIYNSEHYLYECINSVIEQEYNNWELILVDDSSTDSSYHICEDYCSKKSNIRLLKNKSKGVSAARNLGIRNATGDYLVFLDSDDMLSKHALQLLVSMIENYDFGMGTYESLYSNGKRLYHNIHPFKGGMHSFVKKI